jgi:hypothetical protein
MADMAEWVATQPDWETAWKSCDRADWILAIVGRTMVDGDWQSPERRKLAGVAAACARTAWEWMPEAGRACVLLVERHAAGESVSREELRAARMAAADADAADADAYAAARAECLAIVRAAYPDPPALPAV